MAKYSSYYFFKADWLSAGFTDNFGYFLMSLDFDYEFPFWSFEELATGLGYVVAFLLDYLD